MSNLEYLNPIPSDQPKIEPIILFREVAMTKPCVKIDRFQVCWELRAGGLRGAVVCCERREWNGRGICPTVGVCGVLVMCPWFCCQTMHDIVLTPRSSESGIGPGNLVLEGTIKTYRYLDEDEKTGEN